MLNKLFLKTCEVIQFFFWFLSPCALKVEKKCKCLNLIFLFKILIISRDNKPNISLFSSSILPSPILPGPFLSLNILSVWLLFSVRSSAVLSFVSMSMSYFNQYALTNSPVFIFSVYWLLLISKAKKIIFSDSHYGFRASLGSCLQSISK